jgi:HK97 family phage portal protein
VTVAELRVPVLTPGAEGPAVRDVAMTWRRFMGIDEDSLQYWRDFGRAPADEPWLYRCLQLKADFARRVPLRVWSRQPDGTLVLAEDSDDPVAQELAALLRDVNPVNADWADLVAWTIVALSVWGESYWAKVRGARTGLPRELWWLKPTDVDVIKGRTWIEAYVYRSGAGTQQYAPRDIVPIRRPNPSDPTRGLSPLQALRWDLATGRQAAEATAHLLANWSVPPGAWVPDGASTVITPQDRSLIVRVFRALRGPKNQGLVPVLTTPLRWQQMGLSPTDASWVEARKLSRMAVCAALGVPLVLAGDDEKTSVYRQIIDAERVFARNMQGEMRMIESAINSWLVPDFDATRRRVVVAFDYSQDPALQPAWENRWNAWLAAVKSQVVTPNEMRREFRLGADVPWGDQPTPPVTVSMDAPPGGAATGMPDVPGPADEPIEPEESDVADEIEAYGRSLYAHPAIRRHLDAGQPLDVDALVGRPVPTWARALVADGIRSRRSARQIAQAIRAAR